MPERPEDECPYAKPFTQDFDACPAYQQTQFVPLDTQYRTLASVWTCSNLDLGRIAGAPWRHFARCRIGDEAARLQWVGRVREDRLAVARQMQRQLAPLLAERITELWGLKGRQLAAPTGSEEYAAATAELLRRGNDFLVACERFFEEHAGDMRRLEVPIDATVELFRDIIYRWVDQPNAEIPQITEAALAGFPAAARVLLSPESAA
jgi:hypothetical protein